MGFESITGPNFIVPTPPAGDSSNQAADTAFVTSAIRERLTADRTYFVRTDGNDSNNGLTNTAAGAFRTIQKAVAIVSSSLDLNNRGVTIQLADGTYSETVQLLSYVGRGSQGHTTPVILGNASTPSNVVIDGVAGTFAVVGVETGGFEWGLKNLKLQCSGGTAIDADVGSWIWIDNVVFGSSVNHINAAGGVIEVISSYSIVGNFTNHILVQNQGRLLFVQTITITIIGTPAMAGYFTYIVSNALASWPFLLTFSGGVSGGIKFLIQTGGGSDTGGNGMNYFPGATGGTVTSPGWLA